MSHLAGVPPNDRSSVEPLRSEPLNTEAVWDRGSEILNPPSLSCSPVVRPQTQCIPSWSTFPHLSMGVVDVSLGREGYLCLWFCPNVILRWQKRNRQWDLERWWERGKPAQNPSSFTGLGLMNTEVDSTPPHMLEPLVVQSGRQLRKQQESWNMQWTWCAEHQGWESPSHGSCPSDPRQRGTKMLSRPLGGHTTAMASSRSWAQLCQVVGVEMGIDLFLLFTVYIYILSWAKDILHTRKCHKCEDQDIFLKESPQNLDSEIARNVKPVMFISCLLFYNDERRKGWWWCWWQQWL